MTDIDALVAATTTANQKADDFNPDDYETVASRVRTFWQDNPGGRIATEVVSAVGEVGATRWVVRATVWRDRTTDADATGLAVETDSDEGVNATSALENAETSAIGRALANIGLHGDKRASREEMAKVQRGKRRRPRRRTNTTKLREPGDG